MFKKIISFLIIFSIFYSDIAYCGNITYGMFSEEGERSHTTVQAESYFASTDAESLVSRTPSLFSLDEEGFFHIPRGGFNFDAANDGSDEKLLSQWTREEKTESGTQSTTPAAQGWNGLEPHDEDSGDEDEGEAPTDTTPFFSDASQRSKHASAPQWVQVETPLKRRSLTAGASAINFEKEEMGDFVVVVASPKSPLLTPEVEAFLTHVKVRVVDGKLNWKQILGILGGPAVGAVMGYPLLIIFYNDFLMMFVNDSDVLTMILTSALPITLAVLDLDAVSRIASLFAELLQDNTSLFIIQKSARHQISFYLSGGCLYAGAFVAGVLPAYYLYKMLCQKFSIGDKTFDTCSPDDDFYQFNMAILVTGSFCLVLDTTLHYGHQLSHQAKRWIDHYFFRQLRENALFSSAEITRQRYLQQFKEIQKLIDRSSPVKHADLYKEVVRNNAMQETDITVKEALHVLQKLQQFHQQYKYYLTPEEPSHWRKTVSSWIGWGKAIGAGLGRHPIFWYAVDEVLEGLGMPLGWIRSTLSIIFGGIIAGLVQGVIEKDAIQQTVYDMLGGRNITEATSHEFLRRGIMVCNSLLGVCATFPYLWVGFNLIRGCNYTECGWQWPRWAQVLTLTSFGVANALNEGRAFNDSILNIVNGFDSLISYCYPFEGYKRDKLMRITVQLRDLFKKLRPDVLEAVDQLLKADVAPDQQGQADTDPLQTRGGVV